MATNVLLNKGIHTFLCQVERSFSGISLCSWVKSGSALGICQAGTSKDHQIFVPLYPKEKWKMMCKYDKKQLWVFLPFLSLVSEKVKARKSKASHPLESLIWVVEISGFIYYSSTIYCDWNNMQVHYYIARKNGISCLGRKAISWHLTYFIFYHFILHWSWKFTPGSIFKGDK